MKKSPMYEMLENDLNLVKAIKARLINVIVAESQRPTELDANGKAISSKLSDDYYKAASELQNLMSKEAQLLQDLGKHAPDLAPEALEELFFDERGELQIKYPTSYKKLLGKSGTKCR